MPNYGFDINVGGDMLQEMRKMADSINELKTKVEGGTKEIQNRFKETESTVKELGRTIAEVFAIRELFNFGKELMDITAEFEGFRNVIKYSSRDSIDAGDNLAYVESVIRRLHLPMREAYQGFAEMQAGLIGTGIEGEKVRKLFEGISTAASVLHLPAHNLEMVLYDFKEIGERGLNMRNMRSLSGWLPGIAEIVKETFHKPFQELEKAGISGPEFLDKLAGGLQKHFASGLPNAGNSLQAAINDTTSALTRLKLQMGEELRPLFIEIMQSIRKAFDSAPVQYFVTHIKPIAETVMTLIKLWLEYQAGIKLANIAQEAWIAIQSAMALAAGKTEIAIGGAKRSLEGFQEGLNRFNTGLFAMGIGAAIELLMKYQAHLKASKQAYDEMMETVTGQSGMQGQVEQQKGPIAGIRAAMADTTLMKDKNYRDDLLVRAQNLLKEQTRYQVESIKPVTDSLATRIKEIQSDAFGKLNPNLPDYQKGLKVDEQTLATSKANIQAIKELIAELRGRGARSPDYGGTSGAGMNAFSTASLAGASGGLGEAKVVQIHFHAPFQENVVPSGKDLARYGNEAIQGMLRMLNNIALSQSTTQ